ncbi:MAG: fused MFS/spermidine synthase [Phycisphaeraceae bacterium]|nr:fused MFS/spermidine synthase [Phycisphaeraceae bacterium]
MKAPLSRATYAIICGCFLLSGAAGLIYQVAWGKSLGLIFGNTVYATATVLAVFMGGLGVGSAWLGRWSESRTHAVAVYGWVELAVAACGALSLMGLGWVQELYVAAYPWLGGSTASLVGLRFVGAAIVLLGPTFLMGGTLPILVKGVTRGWEELGERVGRLYWVNTLGAVAGTFGAGFWLIPAWGLRHSVATAVAMNVLAGGMALVVSRRVRPAQPLSSAGPVEAGTNPRGDAFMLAAFAVVGATAFVYEVGWTRLLATTILSSTYAFTMMLGTFLVGIMLGSMLFEAWSRRGGRATLGTFALTQTATAVTVGVFLATFGRMPELAEWFLKADSGYRDLLRFQLAVCSLTMLPTAVVFGFNFPVVTALIAGDRGTAGRGAAVGRAYAANTLGAIVGAVLAGFWLVPAVGSYRLIGLAAGVNLALGAVLVWRWGGRSVTAIAGQVCLMGLLVWMSIAQPFFDRAMATFNAVLYRGAVHPGLTLAERAGLDDVVFVEDGLSATISVCRREDYLAIRTNGKTDASNHDMLTQGISGHLGVGLHPSPERVLVIGFGSGMTVATVAAYPDVKSITTVEIEPAVMRAAPLLEPLNRGVQRDPRVRVVVDDARSFMLTTPRRYDVIISEPSNPWIAGVSSLFTEEYYRAARGRLAAGGVLVQWLHAYMLFPEDFRMVLGAIAEQFPRVTLWRGNSGDYLIVAQMEDRPLAFDRFWRMWDVGAVRWDLARMGLSEPESLLAFFELDDADVRRMIGSPDRNTDDHTLLEYRAPLAMMSTGVTARTSEMIRTHRTVEWPREIGPERREMAPFWAAKTMVDLGQVRDATRFMQMLAGSPASADLEVLRGRFECLTAGWDAAAAHFERALRMDPDHQPALLGAGRTAEQRGDTSTARRMYERVLTLNPGSIEAMEDLSRLMRLQGEYAQAMAMRRRVAEARGGANLEDLTELAETSWMAGDTTSEQVYLREMLEREPYSRLAHLRLADVLMGQGDWEGARGKLEFLVRFHPGAEPGMYRKLAEVYVRLGRPSDAAAAMAKGRRLFPGSPALKGEGL